MSMRSFCFLLLTLRRFHSLFWCFHCWLWTSRFRLSISILKLHIILITSVSLQLSSPSEVSLYVSWNWGCGESKKQNYYFSHNRFTTGTIKTFWQNIIKPWNRRSIVVKLINPFAPNAPFLCHLKTPENLTKIFYTKKNYISPLWTFWEKVMEVTKRLWPNKKLSVQSQQQKS